MKGSGTCKPKARRLKLNKYYEVVDQIPFLETWEVSVGDPSKMLARLDYLGPTCKNPISEFQRPRSPDYCEPPHQPHG